MSIIKSATEATGLDETQIREIRRVIPDSPMKKVFAYDIEHATYMRQMNMPKTVEDFHYERGVREGLSIAKGLLERKV